MYTLTHGKAISWGWLLWVMTRKVGMKRVMWKKRKSDKERWLSQNYQLNVKKNWTKRSKSHFHKEQKGKQGKDEKKREVGHKI